MIILGPNSVVISDQYGMDGSKELRALLKKLRLGREVLRNEGHPADEHILMPLAKARSLLESGRATQMDFKAFSALRDSKRQRQSAATSALRPPDVDRGWDQTVVASGVDLQRHLNDRQAAGRRRRIQGVGGHALRSAA